MPYIDFARYIVSIQDAGLSVLSPEALKNGTIISLGRSVASQ